MYVVLIIPDTTPAVQYVLPYIDRQLMALSPSNITLAGRYYFNGINAHELDTIYSEMKANGFDSFIDLYKLYLTKGTTTLLGKQLRQTYDRVQNLPCVSNEFKTIAAKALKTVNISNANQNMAVRTTSSDSNSDTEGYSEQTLTPCSECEKSDGCDCETIGSEDEEFDWESILDTIQLRLEQIPQQDENVQEIARLLENLKDELYALCEEE